MASRPPLAAATAAIGALALAAPGCLPATRTSVRPAAQEGSSLEPRLVRPPIALEDVEDAVVRVVSSDSTCTGTLVADDVVLTAHHCVLSRADVPPGEPARRTLPPARLRVELGGDWLAAGTVGVVAVIVPPCGHDGGGGDVAALVLSRKLLGIRPIPPRLDAPPAVGEPLDPVGFGRCMLSRDAIHRVHRQGGGVEAVSPTTLTLTASVCPGDSGGPLLTPGPHPELVGIVSLSAMDANDRTRAPTLAARIDPFRRVLAHAKLVSDGMAPAELPPLTCD